MSRVQAIADAVKIVHKPVGQRWISGPVCLRDELKDYPADINEYLGWLKSAAAKISEPARLAQAIRRVHYSSRTSSQYPITAANFDELIKEHKDGEIFLSLDDVDQPTLDAIARTGEVSMGSPDSKIDITHLWVIFDLVLNGIGFSSLNHFKANAVDTIKFPIEGLCSWAGDLGSWLVEFNSWRRCESERSGDSWQEPTNEEGLRNVAAQLERIGPRKCSIEDLWGDMDAIVLANEIRRKPLPSSSEFIKLLQDYFRPEPPNDLTTLSVANRFQLFLTCRPEIPKESINSVVRLKSDALDVIKQIIFDAAHLLIYKVRIKEKSRPEEEGLFDGYRSASRDLESPWCKQACFMIAERFIKFLEHGLSSNHWSRDKWVKTPTSLDVYGGTMLQLGDSDAEYRWGGVIENPPVSGVTLRVKTLQENLIQFGFSGVGTVDGVFGVKTAMTLREFQIEASELLAWAERADSSGPREVVEARRRYLGKVHGVLDEETARVIESWMNPDRIPSNLEKDRKPAQLPLGETVRVSRFLDPLELDIRSVSENRIVGGVEAQGIYWNSDLEAQATEKAVFARDHLQRYEIQKEDQFSDPGLVSVGHWEISAYGNGPILYEGRLCWPTCEMRSDTLHKKRQTGFDPEPEWHTRWFSDSLYRVIYAVASAEGATYYESYNAYDSAVLSLGFYHWALQTNRDGELASLLAFYEYSNPDAYRRDFGRLGIWPEPGRSWESGSWLNIDQSKYEGRLGLYGLRPANGSISLKLERFADGINGVNGHLYNYLRSWRMLWRVVMIQRMSMEFRTVQWKLAVQRVRDLLSRPFATDTAQDAPLILQDSTDHSEARVARFGEVFSSEKAIAVLMRYHVNRPGEVVGSQGATGAVLRAYLAVAGGGRKIWSQANDEATARQKQLVTILSTSTDIPEDFRTSIERALTSKSELGPLAEGEKTFRFPEEVCS